VEGFDEHDPFDYMHKKLYGPPLQEYLRYKLGWTGDQIEDTNWAALQGALSAYPLQARTTRMKAMYGWLHTHQWKSRIYLTSSMCPFCSEEDSNDHIWTCQATTTNRETAITTFISSIEPKTPADMTAAIHQRLRTVMDTPALDIHPEDTAPEEVTMALIAQDDLGWINFIRGRHSIKWEEVYDLYLESGLEKNTFRSGRAWAKHLVKASLTLLVDIRSARNDQVHHQVDDEGDISHQLQALHQRVRETYESRGSFSNAMQAKLFDMTLENRLQQRQFQLVKWIQTVEMTARVMQGGRPQPIYAFYHPTRPPDEIDMMATN
jgi:hypothetical protein